MSAENLPENFKTVVLENAWSELEKVTKILKADNFIDLANLLWVEETQEMANLRLKTSELMLEWKEYREKYDEYDLLLRNSIIQHKWEWDKLEIAIFLLEALVYYEWWKKKYFSEEMLWYEDDEDWYFIPWLIQRTRNRFPTIAEQIQEIYDKQMWVEKVS